MTNSKEQCDNSPKIADRVIRNEDSTAQASERKFVCTVDTEDLEAITHTQPVDGIREELKLNEDEFYEKRAVTLVWASDPRNRKVGKAVLVSFYNEVLSECTGQLAFEVLLNEDESARGVSLTHWPNSTKTLGPRFKYIASDSRKNGYPPLRYSANELIDSYAAAFVELFNKSSQLEGKKVSDRFFKGLGLQRSDKGQSNESGKSEKIYIENVIETDGEETNVHLFTYKKKAPSNGARKSSLDWGIVFKFEKPNGEVYWTLDGDRQKLFAHREPPDDIDEVQCESEQKTIQPMVLYRGFVWSSRRDVILRAKEFFKLGKRRFAYKLILYNNCQDWSDELLSFMTSTHEHYWSGPETLDGRYFDEFGRGKKPPLWESTGKRKEIRAPTNCLGRPVELIEGTSVDGTRFGLVKTYEELFRFIQEKHDIQEDVKKTSQEDVFKDTRLIRLYRIDVKEPGVLVEFYKSDERTVEMSFTIRMQRDRLLIARYSGDANLNEKTFIETRLSARALFKWCGLVQQWFLADGHSTNSDDRFPDEVMKVLKLVPTPPRIFVVELDVEKLKVLSSEEKSSEEKSSEEKSSGEKSSEKKSSDVENLKTDDRKLLWDSVREDLMPNGQMDEKRVGTLHWAPDATKSPVGHAVLGSFYNDELSDCTGQLLFKVLDADNPKRGVSLTYWLSERSTKSGFKSLSTVYQREEGYPPIRYTVKDLIIDYARAFVEQSGKKSSDEKSSDEKSSEEKRLCERFIELLGLSENNASNERKPAKVLLENVIETNAEEMNVHMFSYKRPLDKYAGWAIGSVSFWMHWGLILRFEKKQGDVYWTLDGGRAENKPDKLSRSRSIRKFVVQTHRGPPDGIEEIEKTSKESSENQRRPRVRYHGFVRSSPRQLILDAKQLIADDEFQGRYKLVSRNCQQWTKKLLGRITRNYEHFWFGPKTLESKYYDEFGKKKEKARITREVKERDNKPKVQDPEDDLTKPVDVDLIDGERDRILEKLRPVNKYEELLSAIMSNYDIDEGSFKERRRAKLYRLAAPDLSVIVRFYKREKDETEQSFKIRTLDDGNGKVRVEIARYPGSVKELTKVFRKKKGIETSVSMWTLFEWSAKMQQWIFVGDENKEREYSNKRFVEKLVTSLSLVPTPPTAKDLLTLQVLRRKP